MTEGAHGLLVDGGTQCSGRRGMLVWGWPFLPRQGGQAGRPSALTSGHGRPSARTSGQEGRPSALTSRSMDTSQMPTKPAQLGSMAHTPHGSARHQICSRTDTVAHAHDRLPCRQGTRSPQLACLPAPTHHSRRRGCQAPPLTPAPLPIPAVSSHTPPPPHHHLLGCRAWPGTWHGNAADQPTHTSGVQAASSRPTCTKPVLQGGGQAGQQPRQQGAMRGQPAPAGARHPCRLLQPCMQGASQPASSRIPPIARSAVTTPGSPDQAQAVWHGLESDAQ